IEAFYSGRQCYQTTVLLFLQSMNDRRLGRIPDLSTSELLVELFTFAERAGKLPEDDIISPNWFLSLLEQYKFNDQDLPQYVRDDLVNKILVEMEASRSDKLSENLAVLTQRVQQRQVREHSIYTQDTVGHRTFFQGFRPAARYFLSPEKRQQLQGLAKSEGFYDGSSFRTTEALLLPADGDVAGVYVNTHSSQSILQALYIANEFFEQTGRTLPLLTYESQSGPQGTPQLQKMSMDGALTLMRSRLAEEATASVAQAASGASSSATTTVVNPVALFESTLGRSLTPTEIRGVFRDEVIADLAANRSLDFSDFRSPYNQLDPQIRKAQLESFLNRKQQSSSTLPPQRPPKKRQPETVSEEWSAARR
ncbi:MAG: hypothetical protein AAFQ57_17320, partial [Cyanobacteria bacterium J06626_14]